MTLAYVLFYKLLEVNLFVIFLTIDQELGQVSNFFLQKLNIILGQYLRISEEI